MKASKSKRNRHTGVINAFKAMVIKRGEKIKFVGTTRVYRRALIGLVLDKKDRRIRGGYCMVRTHK
jgi:hypothetical protein